MINVKENDVVRTKRLSYGEGVMQEGVVMDSFAALLLSTDVPFFDIPGDPNVQSHVNVTYTF